MSFIQSVAVVSDPGISYDSAPENHSHQVFDLGTKLTLESGFTQHSTDPVRIHTAANWYFLTGRMTRTGATVGALTIVAYIPEKFVPSATSDRTLKNAQTVIKPLALTPGGTLVGPSASILGYDDHHEIEFVGATNGYLYIFSSDWRGR